MASRTLNTPDDVKSYVANQIVFRDFKLPVGRIVEAQWGATTDYDAESVSFIETAPGVWNKSLSLRCGDGLTSQPAPAPTKKPLTLSKTAFMDAAISGIKTANTSTQGAAEARFQEIIEAAKNFAGTTETANRVRYIHERYAGAGTFNKSVVTGMLAFFKAAGVASLTGAEETAILAAWPEA